MTYFWLLFWFKIAIYLSTLYVILKYVYIVFYIILIWFILFIYLN